MFHPKRTGRQIQADREWHMWTESGLWNFAMPKIDHSTLIFIDIHAKLGCTLSLEKITNILCSLSAETVYVAHWSKCKHSGLTITHPSQFFILKGENPSAFCEEFYLDHRPRMGRGEISLSSPSAMKKQSFS